MEPQLTFTFPGMSAAEANGYADELEAAFRTLEGVEVERLHDTENAQDAGTIIGLILSAPAVLIVAKPIAEGIRNLLTGWRPNAILKIKGPNGEEMIEAKNISSLDALRIARLYQPAVHDAEQKK